jgi:metal-dependent amidase/aminoacylase/carboxypeptidase family protein
MNANVIPDEAELQGGVRHLEPGDGKKVERLMKQIVKGICDAMGAEFEIEYSETFLRTVNDEGVIDMCRDVTKRVLGQDMWCEMDTPTMGAEDFSYYIKDYPGAILRIGMNSDVASLHNPHFNFYDDALRNGITFLVAYALEALAQ